MELYKQPETQQPCQGTGVSCVRPSTLPALGSLSRDGNKGRKNFDQKSNFPLFSQSVLRAFPPPPPAPDFEFETGQDENPNKP